MKKLTTNYGLSFSIIKEIDNKWLDYDKVIGKTHLDNFGFIIVDQLATPIDDEHDILEILKIVKS